MLLSLINNPKLSYNLSLALREKFLLNFKLNNSLNQLPLELIEEIAYHLTIEDLFNLCQSDPKYRYLCSDPYIINKVKIKYLNAYYNKFPILKIILKYRKDISEDELINILMWASEDGNLEIIRLLLTDKIINPTIFDNEAIIDASKYGHLEVVKLLLTDERINPADQNNLAIIVASFNGNFEIVQLLLNDARVNPAAQNNLAIRDASHNGYIEIVQLLLNDERVNPADQNDLTIILASERGHLEIVKLLLADERVNPAAQNNAAIKIARRFGHKDIVKLLLTDVQVNPKHLTYEEFLRGLRS